jgi:sigma-E factor negative regulatory protein RseB
MMLRFTSRASFIFLGFVVSSAALAADAAHEWLTRINHAARNLEYDGVFVYQHDTQLEAMRIYHKIENKSVKERLVSLNGAPREIIRDEHEVRCYWPDKNSVVVENRKADSKDFPAILPERLPNLDEYVLQMGNTERITGRPAQQVVIKPTDQYRYGYRLWADRDTGLLLRADLIDAKGSVLEQFMFTQINIGIKIPPAALAPGVAGEGMVWYREGTDASNISTRPGWAAAHLPKGFVLSMHMMRNIPMHKRPVEHLVYTDGLAAVSVFVEQQEKGAHPFMLGPRHMGAVNALGTRVDDYQITAVGEVPAETVSLIGESVVPTQ